MRGLLTDTVHALLWYIVGVVYRGCIILTRRYYSFIVAFIEVFKVMAQNKPKRVRAPDYTDEEIHVIRSSFVKHNTTLSAKHSNDTTQRVKDKIYQSIRLEVNAVGVAERSLQSIKDKWQALKKSVKEKVTNSVRM